MSWSLVWLAVFIVAFLSFVWISVTIAVKGVGEIRELFTSLEDCAARRPPEE